jgi:predicted metal-binding membrane protein
MRAATAAIRVMATGRAWPIVAISALAWAMLAASETRLIVPGLCGDPLLLFGSGGAAGVTALVRLNLDLTVVAGWSLMLAAMMLPFLWFPVFHVLDRSLAERRGRALLLFIVGYSTLWAALLALLWSASIALRMAAGSAAAAFLAAVGIALLWQGSAAKVRFLRRAHLLTPLPAFGFRAELASLRFGAGLGANCAGACWALMFLPLAAGEARLPAMAAAAAMMLSERYGALPRPGPRPRLLAAGIAVLAASAWL